MGVNQKQLETIESIINEEGSIEDVAKKTGLSQGGIKGVMNNLQSVTPEQFVELSKSYSIDPFDLLPRRSKKTLFIYKAMYKSDHKTIARICKTPTSQVLSWLDGTSLPSDEDIEKIEKYLDGVSDVLD